MTPGASWGINLALGLDWRRFSLRLEARGDLPGDETAAGGTVGATAILGTLLPCVHLHVFVGCALGSAGAVGEVGAGYAVDKRTVRPFVGAGARVGVQVPVARRLAIGLHADAIAAITRSVLQVDKQAVFVSPPVSGALGLALVGFFR
jgi:hypothetical protein